MNKVDATAEARGRPSVKAAGEAVPSDLFDPTAFPAVILTTFA
jgi:hypothetical protein